MFAAGLKRKTPESSLAGLSRQRKQFNPGLRVEVMARSGLAIQLYL
jgi:hypothetical protein